MDLLDIINLDFITNQQPATGKLLISEPFMLDPNFKRTVILICEYRTDGTFGLILNRELKLTLADAMPDLKDFDAPLYFGGPVQPDTLHYLHSRIDLLEDSIQVGDELYWGGDFEKLKFLINTQQIQPHEIRFFLGYSGWEGEQLADEISDNSWIVTDNNSEAFNDTTDAMWRDLLRTMGGNYRVISNFPEDPSMN